MIQSLIQRIETLRSEVDSYGQLTQEVKLLLDQKIRLEWTYHSNFIEGNALDLGETRAFLLYHITAKGKSLKDHLDLQGHDNAIKKLNNIAEGEVAFSEKILKEFHHILMSPAFLNEIPVADSTRDVEINPGEFKKIVNFVETITGERVVFTHPSDVPEEIHRLTDWVNAQFAERKKSYKKSLHPLLIAAQFHHRFINIHPFGDGNGRLARLFTNLILMRSGYPPIIIRGQDRAAYFNALNSARAKDDITDLALLLGDRLESILGLYLKAVRGEALQEPDDIDKELAMLKLQLNSRPTLIEKSDESIRQVLRDSILPLFIAIIEGTSGFEELFMRPTWSVNFTLQNNSWTVNESQGLSAIEGVFSEPNLSALNKAVLYRGFFDFRHDAGEELWCSISIEIEFRSTQYIIKLQNSPFVIQGFNMPLSRERIGEIVTNIKTKILETIKTRI